MITVGNMRSGLLIPLDAVGRLAEQWDYLQDMTKKKLASFEYHSLV
jgi:hypothetical protein